MGRIPHVPAYDRVTHLRRWPQRGAGAALTRASLCCVHPEHVCASARRGSWRSARGKKVRTKCKHDPRHWTPQRRPASHRKGSNHRLVTVWTPLAATAEAGSNPGSGIGEGPAKPQGRLPLSILCAPVRAPAAEAPARLSPRRRGTGRASERGLSRSICGDNGSPADSQHTTPATPGGRPVFTRKQA